VESLAAQIAQDALPAMPADAGDERHFLSV
jgi:hypothetical protein